MGNLISILFSWLISFPARWLRRREKSVELPGKILLIVNADDHPAIILYSLFYAAEVAVETQTELHVTYVPHLRHSVIRELVDISPGSFSLYSILVRENYRTAIVASPAASAAVPFVLWLARVRHRVGFRHGFRSAYYNHGISFLNEQAHYAHQFRQLLENFRGKKLSPGLNEFWQVNREIRSEVLLFLKKCGLFRYVLFDLSRAPVGSIDLFRFAKEVSPIPVLFTGLETDSEASGSFPRESCIFSFPGWEFLIEAVREAQAVVSWGDVAGHFAAFLGKPSVTITQPQELKIYFPFSSLNRHIEIQNFQDMMSASAEIRETLEGLLFRKDHNPKVYNREA